MNAADDYIENRTFDEIKVGDSASLERRLTARDIELFAVMSGDVNPEHVDEAYAKSDRFHHVIAHGLWGGALISTVLGTELPGPGTIYVSQSLRFSRPVALGDVVKVTVTVKARDEVNHHLTLDCVCRNQSDEEVIAGEAEVIAPTEHVRRPRSILPEVRLEERAHLHKLLELARRLDPMQTAVVHPASAEAVKGAVEAAQTKLIVPVLVGPKDKILAAAEAAEVDISAYELVDTEHSHEAAEKAVELARAGKVEALMKGSLHTDELMRAVLHKSAGIRTERRISHVFAFDVPTYPRPLFITDAAINIAPTLEEKRDIVQNAIEMAHAVGIRHPKVALLSAVETVTTALPSTLDAAALCKMADRGQIHGGVLDGPLAFDNAVSAGAARTKGIVSNVAGAADILVAPDLDAGNMLAKQLSYLADARGAGIVLGARLPIVLTSRADDALTRMASCALALLVVHHRLRRHR